MPDWYVVTAPEAARGIYDTWDRCLTALSGKKGFRRYMKVSTRSEAVAVLEGRGVVLEPGAYAFTDGNHRGGVGVVLVRMDKGGHEAVVVEEIATSVAQSLGDLAAFRPDWLGAVGAALESVGNTLAEMAAVYVALDRLPFGSAATIVHDFDGVQGWMQGASKPPRDRVLSAVVNASVRLRDERKLRLQFKHQPAHRSDWAGRHDLARLNRRADELASEGAANVEGATETP